MKKGPGKKHVVCASSPVRGGGGGARTRSKNLFFTLTYRYTGLFRFVERVKLYGDAAKRRTTTRRENGVIPGTQLRLWKVSTRNRSVQHATPNVCIFPVQTFGFDMCVCVWDGYLCAFFFTYFYRLVKKKNKQKYNLYRNWRVSPANGFAFKILYSIVFYAYVWTGVFRPLLRNFFRGFRTLFSRRIHIC